MAVAPQTQLLSHLVIVDDREVLATSLAWMLRERGLEAEAACGPSVGAVVEQVRRAAPVLVLLDLELSPPLGSALGLVRPLIEAGGQVVMLGGESERLRLAECVEAGASGILRKAASFAEFVDGLQRALAGEDILGSPQRRMLLDELRAWRQANHDRLAPFMALTPREQAVLTRLVLGESAETIAARSAVSLHTVRSQIKSLLFKLGVSSQLSAVAMARRAGWPLSTALSMPGKW
jgi:DNA-binding NarL/FixJ family response regulator